MVIMLINSHYLAIETIRAKLAVMDIFRSCCLQRSLFMIHFKHNLRWFNEIINGTKDVSSKEDFFRSVIFSVGGTFVHQS